MVTLMAGIILLAMGLTGLGSAVRFIPRPVVIGFTNGIAILIASTQIKDFFGLRVGAVPSEFLPRMKLLIGHMPSLNGQALAIGAATLAIMLILPRIHQARARIDRRAARLHRGSVPGFIFRSKPSALASAEFRADSRPSPFPTSTPSTSCH